MELIPPMKTLKLRPLTIIACLVSVTALGMAAHYSMASNPLNLLKPTSIEPAEITMAMTPIASNKAVIQQNTPRPSVPSPLINTTNPAMIELMRAVVLQSLESGAYTLNTLPIELKPFAPSDFSFGKSSEAEDKAERLAEDTAAIEEKFAEMMADDYVPPEPEFKCPDPNDLPPHLRNSHNIEALKARGCEVYVEAQAQIQPQESDVIDVNYDEAAMYESSI
jgi:hypothetical protein